MVKIVCVILDRSNVSISITKKIDRINSICCLSVDTFQNGVEIFSFEHKFKNVHELTKCFDSCVSNFKNKGYK